MDIIQRINIQQLRWFRHVVRIKNIVSVIVFGFRISGRQRKQQPRKDQEKKTQFLFVQKYLARDLNLGFMSL